MMKYKQLNQDVYVPAPQLNNPTTQRHRNAYLLVPVVELPLDLNMLLAIDQT